MENRRFSCFLVVKKIKGVHADSTKEIISLSRFLGTDLLLRWFYSNLARHQYHLVHHLNLIFLFH